MMLATMASLVPGQVAFGIRDRFFTQSDWFLDIRI